MHGKKEEIPDYGHNMLQGKKIKTSTNLCPHRVEGTGNTPLQGLKV